VLFLVLAYALTVSQANAANETVVKVMMQEWKMEFAPATVQVGSPVRLEIANKGVITHEVVLEKAGEVDKALKAEVNGKQVIADTQEITPGSSKTLTWTFTEPGTYWAACHIPGHFEAGMKVAFTVVPATAAVPSTMTNAPSPTTNAPSTTSNAPSTTTNAPSPLPASGDAAAATDRTSGLNWRLFELDQRLYPPDPTVAKSAQRNERLLRLDMMLYPFAAP